MTKINRREKRGEGISSKARIIKGTQKIMMRPKIREMIRSMKREIYSMTLIPQSCVYRTTRG
jgi:hypothetical protein